MTTRARKPRAGFYDVPINQQQARERASLTAAATWNDVYRVGTVVRYWTGARQGEGKLSTTRTEAVVLSGHTAVVWVEGHSACVALTHVEAVTEETP